MSKLARTMSTVVAVFVVLSICLPWKSSAQTPIHPDSSGRFITVGLYFASIEEGGRIFTPARLLPFDHPEALGHQFPTVQQFHGGEDQLLITLGRQAGLLLAPTLQRYPVEPDTIWPYAPFKRSPVELFASLKPVRKPATSAPLPGLRAIAYLDRFPLAYIFDTRGMSLAERNMTRATSDGTDMNRAQLLEALKAASKTGPATGPWMLVYERP